MTRIDESMTGLTMGLKRLKVAIPILLATAVRMAALAMGAVTVMAETADYAGHRPLWAQVLGEGMILLAVMLLVAGCRRMFRAVFSSHHAGLADDCQVVREEDRK